MFSCRSASAPSPPEATIPEISFTPYLDAADVRFYVPYKADHPGIDVTATGEIVIRAPCSGDFVKELYYHAGVPRWQVNAMILVGDYSVELLFEPGDAVTEAEGRAQFDMIIPDGPVQAGDTLGRLYLAPGNPHSIFHLGVRQTITGETSCPLSFSTPDVQQALLALMNRDIPGRKICYDQSF